MATKKKMTLAQARKLDKITKGILRSVFDATAHTVNTALDGLEPLMSYRGGRGDIFVYDGPKAVAAVERYIEGRKAAKEAERAPVPAAVAPVPVAADRTIQAIGELQQRTLSELKLNGGAIDEIMKEQEHAKERDKLLFKAINDFRADVLKAIGAIQVSPAQETPLAAPSVEPQRPRKRVGIIGLLGNQRTILNDEFGKVLDLRFFDAQEARTKSFEDSLKFCHTVLGMVNFISHDVGQVAKKIGVNIQYVQGGMTTLRDTVQKIAVE